MQALEGWQGRVQARNVPISMDTWKVTPSSTKVAANDFESRYRKNKHGLIGAAVEFSGYVDADNNPFADGGGGLRAGQTIQVQAFLVKGLIFFSFPMLDLFEVECGSEVDGRVNVSCKGETTGSFVYAGGLA